MANLSCDILIIGSGAAGGVLAATLSELTDKKIILTEKGGYFKKEYFTQREWEMNEIYAAKGRRSTEDGAMVVRGGECVGGGTTVNIALCFDPVEAVWKGWQDDYGLQGFSFDPTASDYEIAGLNMANCVQDVRQRLNIAPPADEMVNDNNRLFHEGCQKLGIGTTKFELNMRDCNGCGYCGLGCAYDAKQGTMITYIADALSRGVQLIHHCSIDQLQFENGKISDAKGTIKETIEGSQPNVYPTGKIDISAGLVIVCAGAIETPALLQRSNHPDPHDNIGRGLITHPSLPIVGQMSAPMTNYRGISGSYYSKHFYESNGFYLECLFGHPVYGSVILPHIGEAHFEWMLKFSQLCGFGVMLVDSVDPENRVIWNESAGRPDIHYRLSQDDKIRLRFAAQKGIEVMFSAGANEVVLPSEEPIGPLDSPHFKQPSEAEHCRDLQFLPHQTTITSAHAQATVKMGENQEKTVINSRGESHQIKNLILCDSSSFPTSCGANPMVSIMTMARYQGKRIAGEIDRYFG